MRTFGWAVIVAGCAAACGKSAPSSLAAPVVLPFELRHDLVLVTVAVNGHPGTLILDSGAGAMVLDSAFAHDAEIDISWHDAQVNGRAAHMGAARSVGLGEASLSDVMVVLAPLDAVRARVGHDVRGIIGYDVFKRYVVGVNYAGRTITLAEPATFTYQGAGSIVPIHVEDRLPVLDASIVTRRSGTIPARLQLDLGSANYALRFTMRFATAHDLKHDTVTVTGPFGAGANGASDGDLLRLPQLKLGTLSIERPSAALSHETIGPFGATEATDGTIGEPVFGRMRLIIDYSRSRLIMEPMGRLDVPDSVDASGLTLTTDAANDRVRRVAEVVAGSAGDKAGVRVGDELVGIDGRPADSLSGDEVRNLLRADGVTRRLRLRRDDRTFEVTVRLKTIV